MLGICPNGAWMFLLLFFLTAARCHMFFIRVFRSLFSHFLLLEIACVDAPRAEWFRGGAASTPLPLICSPRSWSFVPIYISQMFLDCLFFQWCAFAAHLCASYLHYPEFSSCSSSCFILPLDLLPSFSRKLLAGFNQQYISDVMRKLVFYEWERQRILFGVRKCAEGLPRSPSSHSAHVECETAS